MSAQVQAELKRGRKCAVDKPDRRHRADHGCDGPAMKARASRLVETVEAGLKIRQMDDDSPIGHYRRNALLTDRQCDALAHLADHYEDSGRRAALTGGYGTRVNAHSEMSDAQARAWKDYCRLLEKAPAATRHAVARVAAGEFPGVSGGLNMLRIAGSALANHLRLPSEGSEKTY